MARRSKRPPSRTNGADSRTGTYTALVLSRRTFLKATGASAALFALGVRCGPWDDEDDPIDIIKGEWIPTGCAGCTSWCAKEVYVADGRATRVRANPRSKVHRDNGCPREHLGLQQLYDPDRVKVPMKRTNPLKGRDQDPGFVPISWDEAGEIIADKLMELRASEETHKLVVLRGRYTQLNQIIYDRVPKILGTPNNISHSSICAEGEKFGPYFTEGYWNYRDYDVAKTRYVLLWGCDPLSANRQVSHYLNAWGDLLDRAQIVTIDPRLSVAASKSHRWLPVRPGEDGALALAMAHVILTEGLWSREFVGDFTDGRNSFVAGRIVDEETFGEVHTHGLVKWWNMELKDRTAGWAAERTGLDAHVIHEVAKGFAQAAPHAISWLGGGPAMAVRGAYTTMAIHALNGLVGSVDSEGGTMRGASLPHKGLPSEADFVDEIAAAGRTNTKIDQRGYKEFPALKGGRSGGGVVTNRVADAILDEDPYDVKMVIGYWCNFNFSCPETKRWEAAMAKVPFFVHAPLHATEQTWFADLVLPSTHHMFEQWGYLAQKGDGYTHCWVSRPLVEKVWDVKNPETEVIWLIGEKLAARGNDNLLQWCKSVTDPETGAAPTNGLEFELYAIKWRLQPIWDPSEHRSGDRFEGWEDFLSKGVWNSDPYTYRTKWGNFETSTGKFELYSETLKASLQSHADRHSTTIDDVLETCKYTARGEFAFVPHYEPPYTWGDPEAYPFVLVDYKSRMNREGRSANCTWYQELKDLDPGDEKWDDVAKINPLDAAQLGISDGMRVRLRSPIGFLDCTAKLWEGVVPGTIAKTFGQGHWAFGRVASRHFHRQIPRGGNNNDLNPADYERLSGSTAFYALTRVGIQSI